MTSNAFVRTISVITILFSLRIYNWTMNNDCTHFRVPLLYRNQAFHWIASWQDHFVLCCSVVVTALCCSNSWIYAFVMTW